MSSRAAKKEGLDSDSGDSKSVSSRPEENDKQPHMRWSDTSFTTNNVPSSASATAMVVSTAVARHPTPRSGLPTLAAAAAAAAPTFPLSEKKPRRAGFGDEFLPMLRVMLDRESQNDSSVVRWSTDGNSFIITDHTQFEAHIIPTYFDNPIGFSSFIRKIYRWGFNQASSRRAGRYEFCSPTFKRLDADSEPAAATAAAAAVNTTGNDGGGAPIQVQQQPAQAFSSSLQQVMAQTNQQPAPNPLPTRQADRTAIMALLSNIQRQLSSQQPSIPSQQSVLTQNTNQPNNNDVNSILQGIMSSNQQPLLSPHSTPSHQPVLNQSTNNPLNMNHFLQSFQQRHHPNPALNLLDTALAILAGDQAPSSAQLMGHPSPSSQSNAMQALMSLYGMMLQQPALTNANMSADMSQLLVLVMQRIVEEEVQRRAQADAIHHAFILTIGQFVGGNNMIDEAERQRGLVAALGQTHGSTGETTTPGMTSRAPCRIAVQSQQEVGTPPPPAAGNLNIQADFIAAILQAARRGDVAGQLEDDNHARNGPDNGDNEDGNDDREGRQLSQRKRKSPNDDADFDDSWSEKLRPRTKSPRK